MSDSKSAVVAELLKKHSRDLPAGAKALAAAEVKRFVAALPKWKVSGKKLSKTFAFKDYYETMAFVNAMAWVSHAQNHHPDLEVGYNKCVVRYSTHSVGGLSENDFICAARVEELMSGG